MDSLKLVLLLYLSLAGIAFALDEKVKYVSLHDFRAQLSRLETMILAQDNKLKQLENDNQDLREEIRQLQAHNQHVKLDTEKLKEDNNHFKRENQQLKAEYMQVKAFYLEAKSHIHKLTKDEENLKKRVQKLEADNAELLNTVRRREENGQKHRREVSKDIHFWNHSPEKTTRATKPATSPAKNTESEEGGHDLVTRADDVSSLQVVVDQLGQRMTAVDADVEALKKADQQLSEKVQQAGTSSYTRWGHGGCPSSNDLVYSGVVGGSYYHHTGAATNVLCMSMSPVFSSHRNTSQYAHVYGAEYETEDSEHNKDPVCAVCRSPRPNTVMISGTNVCMDGWTLEYSGYIMAGRFDFEAATEYICVDSSLQSRPGGNGNEVARQLMFTLAQCGSLPCGPYVQDKIVTCAVCSQ